MAKGIRVNLLAKELGVPSKAILDRCKAEGLGEKVPNHMSVLSIGLAETLREWFAGQGGVATATETEAPAEEAAAHAPSKRKHVGKKKVEEHVETAPTEEAAPAVDDGAVAHAPPAAAHTPVAEAPAPVVEAPVHEEPVYVAPHAPTPAYPVQVAPPAPIAPPVHVAETAAPHAPHAPRGMSTPKPLMPVPPVSRPTIKLDEQIAAQRPTRKPVTVAPQLVTREAPKMQGPRVVREEKPDIVSAPRRPRPEAGGAPGPGFTTARPATGRGVRTTDEEGEDAEKKKAGLKGGRTNSQRRRGPDGRRGEANEKLREFSEADLEERRIRLGAAASYHTGIDNRLKKSVERGTHQLAKSTIERGEPVQIEEPITVKTLAAALGLKTNDVMYKLVKQGVMATTNQALDHDVAGALALEYGIELQVVQEQTLEEQLESEFADREPVKANLATRPPVVTILGHVDHGKTSLLDKIRNANVAAGEAGGITQHTAAWMVTLGKGETAKRVTFIDTPGHQAFTSMRARGANMTDVVVLVVSAAEGVQPQTIESINHARAAGVPIVVAMNKIDRADANPDMILGQLAAQNLNPVEWGGDTEVIRTSAVTGQGITELIEILDYQSQLLELKADPTTPARGTVIESFVRPGLGPVATVLVQNGTLRVGDNLLSGPGYGRIRTLLNDRFESIPEAGPSTPVIVSGLSQIPSAGDKFFVVDDLERARSIAEERATRSRQAHLASAGKVTAENLFATMKEGDVQAINLIIKGDVQGSVETLVKTVTDSNTDEVKVRVIHSGVGAINESDVELAIATMSKPTDNRVSIIGFHVVPDEAARTLAEQNHVELKLYRVIYEIFDDLKKALSGMLEPEVREKLHGHAEVRKVIKVSKIGNIAGCLCTDGHIQRGSRIRLIRNGVIVTEDLTIESLKRVKDDVREVKSGLECGIKIANYDDIKEGDVFEAYIRETFQRTL